MKLNALFKRAVEIGIEADPRGKARIEKELKKHSDKAKKLDGKEKELFDHERTWNPFPDTRVLVGSGDEEVTRLLVGVDIETAEILLADRLREKGEKIDAIMVHHPEGRALADLDKQMPMQIDMLAHYGVPVNVSEGMLKSRMDRIFRSLHSDNLFRTERAAELMGFPLFTCHTVTDNLAWRFIEDKICTREFDDLQGIVNALLDIEEYKYHAKKGNPPIIVNGSSGGRPGKVVASEYTGGTDGPEDFIRAQAQAGVGTIIAMHAPERVLDEARKQHVNIVQSGHMASDVLGMNLLLDRLSKDEKKLETVDVSGFVRMKRK
jgi:hypothetical protein